MYTPFQCPKVGKDFVALVLHFPVDALDINLFNKRLKGSAVVFHTGTCAKEVVVINKEFLTQTTK